MRKKPLIIIGLLLVLAAGAYSAFWYFSAENIKKVIAGYTKLSSKSISVSGFPTSYRFTLDTPVWAPAPFFSLSTDKAVLTGNWLHTTYELTIVGDVIIKQPGRSFRQHYTNPLLTIKLKTPFAWRQLPSNIQGFLGQIYYFSYSDEGMINTDLNINKEISRIAGNHVVFDVTRHGDTQQLKINFEVKDLVFADNSPATPAVNSSGDITVTLPSQTKGAEDKPTANIAINHYALSIGKTSLEATGSFSAGVRKLPLGEISAHIKNFSPLADILVQKGKIRESAALITRLQKIAEPGTTKESMQLRIKADNSGKITIGNLTLPEIITLFADINK